MTKYTHRFAEDFVIGEAEKHDSNTPENTTSKFLSLHGSAFNDYLQCLAADYRKQHEKDIQQLDQDSKKHELKTKLVEALINSGLLGRDEKDIVSGLMGIDILFLFSGYGKGGGDKIECDLFQIHKYQTDFPADSNDFTSLAYGAVFHEIGHSFQYFSKINGSSISESFAQGISRLAMEYSGEADALTSYYRRKAEEIQSLDPKIRNLAAVVLRQINIEAKELHLELLGNRVHPIAKIYCPSRFPGSIERYANPLSLEELMSLRKV